MWNWTNRLDTVCGQRWNVHFQSFGSITPGNRQPHSSSTCTLCHLSPLPHPSVFRTSFDPIQSTFCVFLLLPLIRPSSMPSFVYPRGPSVVLFLIRLMVPSTPLEFPALPIVQDQGASCCNKLLNNVGKGYRPQFQLTLWSLISQCWGGHIINDRPTAGESTLKALSLPSSAMLCVQTKVSSGFIVVVVVKKKTLQRPYLLLFQH